MTHCNRSSRAQKNILEEFAAHRFFNLLSEASYRVRLLNINYIDTENKYSAKKLAFVIESSKSLATRTDGEQAHLPAVSLKQMNDRQLARFYLFQYLIGNTDWSLVSGIDKENC